GEHSAVRTWVRAGRGRHGRATGSWLVAFFFFKQKTAYEIGLGIPAEPLFRSNQRYGSSHIGATATKEIQYLNAKGALTYTDIARSEERRVGKECRSRWSPYA